MKFNIILFLTVLLTSCTTKVEITDIHLGGESIYSSEIKIFEIGEIDSSQTIISLDNETTLLAIERDLFKQDTCCSYSNPFTLSLKENGKKFRVNARLYRFCSDFYIPAGEQT